MKAKYLFMSMFAALAFTGCSNDDDVANPDRGTAGESQYLQVNLVTNKTTGTRAGGGQTTGEPSKDDPNATYEEGYESENKVNSVRFYFFDGNGDAAAVKKVGNSLQNYLDVTSFSDGGQGMPNIEKILGATLIIQTGLGDEEPAQIVAIINPATDLSTEQSLTSLGEVYDNYLDYTDNNFVMSNSTYKGKDNLEKMAVSVEGKMFETAAEALESPVDIYVERTVAKVRLGVDEKLAVAGKENIFKTNQTVDWDGDGPEAEEEIFVHFLGWNTTAVADKGRLIKDINPDWAAALFGTEPWNWSDYFRSFWAINAPDLNYLYGAFRLKDKDEKDIPDNDFQAQAKTEFDGKASVYVNENATDNAATGQAPTTPTKVIIAAQLVDANDDPIEMVEFGSKRITVTGFKNLIANNSGLYKKTVNDDKTTYDKITPVELTIKTAMEVGEATPTTGDRYKSYVQLDSEAEKTEWYAGNTETAKKLTKDEANKALLDLSAAKVWTSGYTYYYFDIAHLGTMKAGVVRNHIYDATITSLTGLGTPVYNPDEIIYPEKPDPDEDKDTFIAARINILSWRVVNNEVTLEW